ncbi:MAG: hypothetical protein WCF62_15460, partial [Pseudolabrys sp.]
MAKADTAFQAHPLVHRLKLAQPCPSAEPQPGLGEQLGGAASVSSSRQSGRWAIMTEVDQSEGVRTTTADRPRP